MKSILIAIVAICVGDAFENDAGSTDGDAAETVTKAAVYITCGMNGHDRANEDAGWTNMSFGAEYVSAERVGLSINADIMDVTSDVWGGISYHCPMGRITLKPMFGIGWGHYFTKAATDHNYHTYRIGVGVRWRTASRLGFELMPMALGRDWQGHLVGQWRLEVSVKATYRIN